MCGSPNVITSRATVDGKECMLLALITISIFSDPADYNAWIGLYKSVFLWMSNLLHAC